MGDMTSSCARRSASRTSSSELWPSVSCAGSSAGGGGRGAGGVGVQLAQALLRAFHQLVGHSGQGSDLDAVAFVGRAAHDAAQENNAAALLAGGYGVVAHPVHLPLQGGELMVVRGQQRLCAEASCLSAQYSSTARAMAMPS